MVKRSEGLSLVVVLLTFVGCASAPPKKVEEPKFESRHKAVNPLEPSGGEDDGMKVQGLTGTLDPSQVRDALDNSLPRATRCYSSESRRKPYLGGEMQMKFRVNRDGSVKTVILTSSSVGSLAMERCVLKALGATRFPRPMGGGEAEFNYPLTFPARMGSQSWEAERIAETMEKVKKSLAKEALPAGLVVTLYISPRGALVSAGMYASENVDEALADKVLEALQVAKFKAPQSHYAKVVVTW